MAILGGSPLGLIGLSSGSKDGVSTFNGGVSRNVFVDKYNKSNGGSLFSGQRRLRAWPDIRGTIAQSFKLDKDGTMTNEVESEEEPDTTGYSSVYKEGGKPVDGYKSKMTDYGSNQLHNNDVYDTSVLNLVEKLAGTLGALRPQDFAYLKDLGVYPNNRLMIARRFLGPVGDNLMTLQKPKNTKLGSPKFGATATLISWRPEGDDFLEIQFGEEWEPAKADFVGMLNAIGDDFVKGGLGKIASAAANAVPLPGFTEIFQRKFLVNLGLLETDAGNQIPAGNPNLIKEAKKRKTIGYSEAGSGLMCKVSIKMICEYELKFISGIDPTMVWMDLLGMIVRFGTSESSNYGLSKGVAAKLARWTSNPQLLLSDIINGIKSAITGAKKQLEAEIKKVYEAATIAAESLDDGSSSGSSGTSGTSASTPSARAEARTAAEAIQKTSNYVLQKLIGFANTALTGTILKYKVEIMGIVSALTGGPSTPWHITIGNPLRPIFCSGDMLTTEVTLKLGSTLAFNDLPSSITVEFTLTNARNWGLQEIMAKFNSGYLRTVDVQRSFLETNIKEKKTKAGVSEGIDVKESEKIGDMFMETKIDNPADFGNGGKSKELDPAVIRKKKTPTPAEVQAEVQAGKDRETAKSGLADPIQTKSEGGAKPVVADNTAGKEVNLPTNPNAGAAPFSSIP
jgi:hypothetical protein